MIQIYVIAACVIVHLGGAISPDARGVVGLYVDSGGAVASGWWGMWVGVGNVLLLTGLWLVGQSVCVRAGRRMDTFGWGWARSQAELWIMGTRMLAIVVHAIAVLGFGWLGVVRSVIGDIVLLDEAVAVSPMIVFIVAGWWSVYPLDRRLREASLYRELHASADVALMRSRIGYVVNRVRESIGLVLIPIALATGALELFDRYSGGVWLAMDASTALAPYVELARMLAQAAIVLCVLAVAPGLVRLSWDLVKLEDGPTRHAIDEVLKARPVRVIGPLVWRTGGESVNAAILGAVWPLRYMVFTDGLLSRMSRRQIAAVAAHEVAHVKLHHMPWMIVSVIASLLGLGWVAGIVLWGVESLVGLWIESEFVSIGMSLVLLVPMALVFGMVSRRMEWQADAFAVKVMSEVAREVEDRQSFNVSAMEEVAQDAKVVAGDVARQLVVDELRSTSEKDGVMGGRVITSEAVHAMASALQAVADLNGMRTSAYSFRHGSIAYRQRRVIGLVGQPLGRVAIDRQVRLIKWACVVLIVAALVPMVVEVF